ncbi:MAG: sulfotransferase domain-containing protein [Pirellulaceae bacterium]
MSSSTLSRAWQLHRQGDLDAAREACLDLLDESQISFELLHLLGVVELQQGRAPDAALHLRQAAEMDRENAEVWNHLAIANSKLGQDAEAIRAFERSVSIAAAMPDVHFNLALAYSRAGRVEDAIASLRRAIELRPEFVEARTKLGKLLGSRGDLAAAVETLRTALAIRPNHVQAQRVLAKCLEQREKGRVAPAPARFGESLSKLSEMEVEASSRAGDERLFFVFGEPKSGTTWLQMLLDTHPDVACRTEDQFAVLFDGAGRLAQGYNKVLDEVDRRTAQQGVQTLDEVDAASMCVALIRRLLSKRLSEPGVLRSGAKDNGIVQMFDGFVQHFSGARFVYIVRDPRDVAVSSWYHNLRIDAAFESQAGTLEDWSRRIAVGWSGNTASVLETASRLGDRFHVIRYEDLCVDPEPALHRLFAFLEVRSDAPVVRRIQECCSFESLSGARGPGEEDRGSFFRRGVSGDWVNHFGHATANDVLAIAGEAMARFGYR